ncbi:electron transport complex subunit E [Cellvibrio japonicus]|uniref:Ion-translocating oxidoreductase complex subunit E n=1 Tax=Cellvibrio japonicus (strain Ueda107) TaxID=498211 RepID=RNFE_CELJU|nr:electron transport complex subunit E [Cellvibrio japonicus]B3PB31.1 RecName: Full=Ion-translocating oxidoreductase complex subunit E; AltName: Full=Rnf electron transport complex subunit E [Cellvibrio japonicus Ueda107]ACE86013.1 electron transport complex, RnfABCDGE type, E subunit [Cellvibrio japonicus Ueda107]QEI11624.1 electron transport complex subunit E [Cellvibrio japonicus]QEI15198.1 electron transport complex subunit E [Cellvibrio japonicus]QEI18778.1 electron transport complex sub
MSDVSYREITAKGLWSNNPALVQLLGLCPLLAVSSSVVNALGLGIATLLVLVISNSFVSLIRRQVSDAVRLPAFVMIIASAVTCTELLMKAFTYELYQILGLFIPLIVTNCAVLGRADAFASKNKLIPSAVDGFMMGLGFMLVLVAVGAVRELLGTGHLFGDMHLIFGEGARSWQLNIFGADYPNVIFALLPPGAFIVVGMLIAAKNSIDAHLKKRADARKTAVSTGSKRVRTTGAVS